MVNGVEELNLLTPSPHGNFTVITEVGLSKLLKNHQYYYCVRLLNFRLKNIMLKNDYLRIVYFIRI